jgi:hypothetical protein
MQDSLTHSGQLFLFIFSAAFFFFSLLERRTRGNYDIIYASLNLFFSSFSSTFYERQPIRTEHTFVLLARDFFPFEQYRFSIKTIWRSEIFIFHLRIQFFFLRLFLGNFSITSRMLLRWSEILFVFSTSMNLFSLLRSKGFSFPHREVEVAMRN